MKINWLKINTIIIINYLDCLLEIHYKTTFYYLLIYLKQGENCKDCNWAYTNCYCNCCDSCKQQICICNIKDQNKYLLKWIICNVNIEKIKKLLHSLNNKNIDLWSSTRSNNIFILNRELKKYG